MDKNTQNMFNRLPKTKQQREELKEAIFRLIKKLKKEQPENQQQNESIKTLNLRLQLIEACSGMSLLRLDHLLQIFKHYCTHIFRTGKYMTFERLEYEKVHITMDRFFFFLKDFQLTLMQVKEKKQEILDKSWLITLFKKISSNAKDLNFEEFITFLQKIAVMYYDEKLVYFVKKQQKREEKQKRREQFEKKRLKKLKSRLKKAGESDAENEQEDNDNDDDQENEKQQASEKEEKVEKEQEKQSEEKKDNDDLVDDLMNDDDLEDPNEQVKKITNRYAIDSRVQEEQQSPKRNKFDDHSNLLLLLTNEQKIEYFYQIMIRVDNVTDYRKRMSEMNLPTFKRQEKQKIKPSNKSQTKIIKPNVEQNNRIQELKKRMDEKKVRQKASPIPKPKDDGGWSKAQEEKRKKRQLKKQREQKAKDKAKKESDAVLQKKIDVQKMNKEKEKQKQKEKKGESYNEKEVDWNSIGKLSIDQLKLKQFNPNKFFSKDDDDKVFLDEYEGGGGRKRLNSGFVGRDRQSMSIVEDMKKRVNQVEKKQKRQDKQLDNLSKKLGQNIPVKNRF